VGRKWALIGIAVLCVVVAMVVTWWPEDDATVQVVASDENGICVRDLSSGEEQCLAYTPEFPTEARYREDECLRLRWVYRSDVPPHAERVSCPG
jgi:hypothetical protein